MRLKFADEKNVKEQRERAAVIRRIDAWWSAFEKAAPRIDAYFSEGKLFDVPAFMRRHLDRINPRLMWEFGPPLRRGRRHRLVITAESDLSLGPLVDTVLARAPRKTVFEFHAVRPAVSVDAAMAMVRGRSGVSVDGWSVRVTPTEDFGVDLTFVAPRSVAKSEGASYAGLVATECLLGGDVFEAWVDGVEVRTRVPKGAVPLRRLAEVVASTLKRLRAKLPSTALVKSTSARNGSVYELEPTRQADYPRQKDVFVGATTNLPLSLRWLSGRTFSSRRFSRAGETFCYLKIDGTDGLDPGGFSDRGDIEDALDAALIKARLGATYAGATGLMYSYVELSVRDVERAMAVIKRVLRSGHIPKRTWLLFHDTALHGEWVGIWDDTPPPP